MDLQIDLRADRGNPGPGPHGQRPVTRRLLRERGYSLQANAKTTDALPTSTATPSSPTSSNHQATDHLATGDPVISVDTKKKELVGSTGITGGSGSPKASPSRSRSTTSSTPN